MKVGKSQSDSDPRIAASKKRDLRDITNSEFETSLDKALNRGQLKRSVSEEELFSAVSEVLVKYTGGDDALSLFRSVRATTMDSLREVQSIPSYETGAKKGLQFLKQAGVISAENQKEIRSVATQVAQLDQISALYDRIGGANDPTYAVAKTSRARSLVIESFQKLMTANGT